jgi:hypothetical protein
MRALAISDRGASLAGVVADDSGQRDVRFQMPQQIGDTGGSAGPDFLLVGSEHDDRGFWADAFGVAPGVAVEHQVAQDQDPFPGLLAELLEHVVQV